MPSEACSSVGLTAWHGPTWTHALGWADLRTDRPATTPQMLLVNSTALLLLQKSLRALPLIPSSV